MKKIKTFCKKAVAVIEVAAMTVALVGGLSLVGASDVSAAEGGILELNVGTKIVSDTEEVLSFTAPADGTYYFYSVSNECDPYATLKTEADEIYMDDYESNDGEESDYSFSTLEFRIAAELSEGEKCELAVNTYEAEDGEEYETTVYVCNEETAQTIPLIVQGGCRRGVSVGGEIAFTVSALNVAGTEIVELPEGYSVKWFSKYDVYDEETDEDITYTNDLDATGTTYTIDEVTEEDLCTEETDYLYYVAALYNGEEEISTTNFYLDDIDEVNFYGTSEYVNVGDELTFSLQAYDYCDEEIDLSEKEDYSYVWYKATEDEEGYLENHQEIPDATEYSYTFDVTSVDFCEEKNSYVTYVCEIYADGECVGETSFRVYNIAKALYIDSDYQYAKVGETVTFVPKVYDYDDEEVDLESNDNYSFKWYKVTEDEEGEYVKQQEVTDATGYSCTVNVTAADFCEEANEYVCYMCELYLDGEYIDFSTFRVYNSEVQFDVYGNDYYINEGDDVTLVPEIYDFDGNKMDINSKDFTFTWYSYNFETDEDVELGNNPTLTIENYNFDSEIEYYVYVSYKGNENYAYFSVYNGKTAFIGGYGDYPGEIGGSVTITPIIYGLADGSIAVFDDTFSFEWHKVTYYLEEETVYGDVIGTDSTYTIKEVAEDDLYDEETNMVGYACRVYRDGTYVTEYHAEITEASAYWKATGDELTVSVGDKVTLKPVVTDGYGQEIDINNERYQVTWYDSDFEEIGTGDTYTIDSVTSKDFYDTVNYSLFIVSIYDTVKDENREATFRLYEKENGGEEPTTEAPTTGEPTTEAPTTKAPEITTTAPKTDEVKAPAKAKIKKIKAKKKSAKKVKVTLKKIKSAAGYQVAVYKTKKNAKKNKKAIVKKFTKKVKVTLKSKKLKNKKKLFVKARAYVLDSKGKKVYGKWSKVKKVKVK